MPSNRSHGFVGLCAIAASVSLLGCDAKAPSQKVATLSGRVFLGDEPLEFGRVMLQPMQGGQPATGEIQSDGRFVLSTYKPADGAIVGRHKVRVVSYSTQDPESGSKEPSGDSLGDLLIPQRYASFALSGIEVSVLDGGNGPFIIRLQPNPDDVSEVAGEEKAQVTPSPESPADSDDASGESSDKINPDSESPTEE